MARTRPLAPLAVVIPMLGATVSAGLSFLPRRAHETIAVAAAVGSTTLCAILLVHAKDGPIVYWLGNWTPHHDVALGASPRSR
jgi:formate hydrogenlyase subunit 3/multisubunit Na+/H+ antiporter MnhD subunit